MDNSLNEYSLNLNPNYHNNGKAVKKTFAIAQHFIVYNSIRIAIVNLSKIVITQIFG